MLESIQLHHSTLMSLAAIYGLITVLAAMHMLSRANGTFGNIRMLWALLGAGVMAIGLWSTHSLGLLASWNGAPKFFAVKEILFSAGASATAALAASFLVSRNRSHATRLAGVFLIAAGFFLTCIFGLHSIRTSEALSWNYESLLGTAFISCCLVAVALHVSRVNAALSGRLLSALFLVVATGGFYFSAARILLSLSPDRGALADAVVASMPLYIAHGFLALFFLALLAAGYCLERYMQENAMHIACLNRLVGQLRQSEKSALDADQSKAEFVADISHELRTPLNGIIGMHRLILDSRLNKEQRRNLELADEAARALLGLTNDILDLSKIDAGKFRLEEKSFSIRDLLESVVALMSPACREKGLSIKFTVDESVPSWLLADSDRLRQILFNIVGNAIKFTSEGGVNMSAMAAVENERVLLTISVADTGIGMTRQDIDALFTRYGQANSNDGASFGGTGLGLSISQRLAVLMGGDITVNSKPNAGSTFDIRIVCEEGAPAPMRTDITVNELHTDGKPLCLLVADDNTINQRLLTELLKQKGHQCDVVANGRDAVAAWRNKAYDAILMDLHMPGGDGIEATRKIRASDSPRASTPIILLTASIKPQDCEKLKCFGITSLVAKPIDPDKLWTALEKCASGDDDAVAALPSLERAPSTEPQVLDLGRLKDLHGIFGADELRLQLADVIDQSAREAAKIRSALQTGDLKSAKMAAHTLNGMAGSWAAAQLSDIARRIENDASNASEAFSLLEKLETSIDGTKRAVSEFETAPELDMRLLEKPYTISA